MVTECFDSCQMGRGCVGMDEEMRGLRSTNRQLQNSHGDVNYNIGNGVAKELIHMTHGHEQWDCLREWVVLGWGCRGDAKGKNRDNCNSITNKYNFKNKIKPMGMSLGKGKKIIGRHRVGIFMGSLFFSISLCPSTNTTHS